MKMSSHFYMENMKTVYRIGYIFGLVSPIKEDGFKTFKLYTIMLILLICSSAIGSVYLKLNYDTIQKQIAIYLNVIGQLLSITMISIIIYRTGFLNIKEFSSVKTLLKEVDFGLKNNETRLKPGKLYTLFKFIVLLFIIYLAIELTYTSYSVETFAGNSIGKICDLYFIVSMLLIYNYVFLINTRLRIINQQVTALLEKHKIFISDFNVTSNRYGFEITNLQEELTKTRMIFNSALKVHSICNAAFGWNFLFIMFTIFVQLLQDINKLILEILQDSKAEGVRDTTTVLCYIGFGCLFLCIMGVVVAAICNTTTKEVQTTATICYNLLSDVPADSNLSQDRILREELILLAEHATNQCPHFSAAGFFNINYSMLLGFIGTLTSYVIVLIQINT